MVLKNHTCDLNLSYFSFRRQDLAKYSGLSTYLNALSTGTIYICRQAWLKHTDFVHGVAEKASPPYHTGGHSLSWYLPVEDQKQAGEGPKAKALGLLSSGCGLGVLLRSTLWNLTSRLVRLGQWDLYASFLHKGSVSSISS